VTTSSSRLNAATLHAAVRAVMVDAAERAILPRFRQLAAHDVREKATDELVTIADVDSEGILSEGLGRILPEAAIVGEEAADADRGVLAALRNRLCWISGAVSSAAAALAAGLRWLPMQWALQVFFVGLSV
jgi:3'-phosphoadenosine 5'-phosphosulfate (PAPS) 3'-phosphatase